jgi:hypothetical protein
MLAFLKLFANNLPPSRDGVSFIVIRVGAVVTGNTFVGVAIFALVVNKQPLDPLTFGSGAATRSPVPGSVSRQGANPMPRN